MRSAARTSLGRQPHRHAHARTPTRALATNGQTHSAARNRAPRGRDGNPSLLGPRTPSTHLLGYLVQTPGDLSFRGAKKRPDLPTLVSSPTRLAPCRFDHHSTLRGIRR